MNINLIALIGIVSPFVLAILVFFFRIETRLSKIEVDISWIKKVLPTCLPSSEENTQ